mgnify:CR=1 FL=1
MSGDKWRGCACHPPMGSPHPCLPPPPLPRRRPGRRDAGAAQGAGGARPPSHVHRSSLQDLRRERGGGAREGAGDGGRRRRRAGVQQQLEGACSWLAGWLAGWPAGPACFRLLFHPQAARRRALPVLAVHRCFVLALEAIQHCPLVQDAWETGVRHRMKVWDSDQEVRGGRQGGAALCASRR